ncbi:hypothetical protein BX600DRAFT_460683 [Xylariales sp. PMI_506]|nr:hypothetical protein BX600DRAFT_460683 [Xylariales sp. PMI_506]
MFNSSVTLSLSDVVWIRYIQSSRLSGKSRLPLSEKHVSPPSLSSLRQVVLKVGFVGLTPPRCAGAKVTGNAAAIPGPMQNLCPVRSRTHGEEGGVFRMTSPEAENGGYFLWLSRTDWLSSLVSTNRGSHVVKYAALTWQLTGPQSEEGRGEEGEREVEVMTVVSQHSAG